MPNEAQREAWAGERGEHWAEEHERYDRMLADYGRTLVDAVAAQPGERVLDVGCGNGAIAAALVDAGAEVVGVDISTPMLARARARTTATFVEADAQVHDFDEASFDAIVSRFGVMFFDDPAAAFANLRRALRRGGRLAFICWRELGANEWMLVPAMAMLPHVTAPAAPDPTAPGPFAFADEGRVRSLLTGAGFEDVDLTAVNHRMLVGPTVDEAMAYYRRSDLADRLLGDVPADVRERALQSVADAMADKVGPDGLVLEGSAWLVTAKA